MRAWGGENVHAVGECMCTYKPTNVVENMHVNDWVYVHACG